MKFFGMNKKNGGFMDEIRCDESSYLIWKWHPVGSKQGDTKRENAIRFGSSLRVNVGEVAVFVYTQEDGTKLEYIEGPCTQKIETYNFPILASIIGMAYDGGTPFQAEVYFINLAQIIQVRFGVPFFDIYDSRFSDFGVPVAVRGTISFKIGDYCRFIQLHKLSNFNIDDFQKQIRDAVIRCVKEQITETMAVNNIPLVQIETKIAQINVGVEVAVSQRLKEVFGVDITGVDIAAIEIDKSSEGYRHLMSVTRDYVLATVKAETTMMTKESMNQFETE